jgi:carboxyl-terminal processing protease
VRFSLKSPLLALVCLAALGAPAPPPAGGIEPHVKKFLDIFTLVEQQAADPVPPEKAFYEGAIPGMLKRLDPHSVFFDPGQFEQLKQMQRSERKGFGTVVSILPGRVVVLQTMPGSPSAKAGISAGDQILAINGIALNRLEPEQLIELLTYSRQHQVNLVIRRPGIGRLMEFTLNPEEMESPSVERAFLLAPGIAFLRVSSFDEQTGRQIRQAIEKLGGARLRGLVLDLRNNPGGVLTAAIETAGLFLQPDQLLLSVKGRSVRDQEVKVAPNAKPYTFPVSVLINAKSASASEIVAGALQDHDRAAVLGEPSFGKGLVQSVYPLSSGTGLALTTAFYYTPSGRSIQKRLEGSQLEGVTAANSARRHEYHTDSGRTVLGGGGIQPDRIVQPHAMSPLRVALEASGSFTSFATEFTQKNPGLTAAFDLTPSLLDDFKVFAAERNIQPSVGEWLRERDWIRSRLKTEIFNQSLGVAKGDEVEAAHDPQVLAAIEALKLAK